LMTTGSQTVASEPVESTSHSATRGGRHPHVWRVMFFGILGVLVVVVGFQAWALRNLRHEMTGLQKEPPMVAGAPDLSLDDPVSSMTAQSWNAFEEMRRMHGLMNQAFDRSFARLRQHPMMDSIAAEAIVPSIDLREEPDKFILKADVPGATEGSVKVEVTGQQVTIEGSRESQREQVDSSGLIIRQERETGIFSRSVTLPKPVVGADMKSDLEDGVLTITIPKASHS
ncbi:MAG: Hsp20/alpha crystallin family protein, partial [Polyangiales bacterium]